MIPIDESISKYSFSQFPTTGSAKAPTALSPIPEVDEEEYIRNENNSNAKDEPNKLQTCPTRGNHPLRETKNMV